MNELLNLLKDGHARTTLMLASELHTTPADIRRKLEFLENAGMENDPDGRKGKSGCSGCIPGAELMNMGEMWEVVR